MTAHPTRAVPRLDNSDRILKTQTARRDQSTLDWTASLVAARACAPCPSLPDSPAGAAVRVAEARTLVQTQQSEAAASFKLAGELRRTFDNLNRLAAQASSTNEARTREQERLVHGHGEKVQQAREERAAGRRSQTTRQAEPRRPGEGRGAIGRITPTYHHPPNCNGRPNFYSRAESEGYIRAAITLQRLVMQRVPHVTLFTSLAHATSTLAL